MSTQGTPSHRRRQRGMATDELQAALRRMRLHARTPEQHCDRLRT